MKEALRLRKATPAEIARFAIEAGIWEKIVQPRLEALTVDDVASKHRRLGPRAALNLAKERNQPLVFGRFHAQIGHDAAVR